VQSEFSLLLVKKNLIDKTDERFKSLMRWKDVDLFRQPLSFLFPPDAHERLDKLLEVDEDIFKRVTFPRVPLRLKTGGYINFDMKIEVLEGETRRLDFFKPGKTGSDGQANDAATTDMYSFFNFVEKLLNSPFDEDLDLTMIDSSALRDGVDPNLDESEKKQVREEIEHALKKQAVGGQLGQLDEASYGLLTKSGFDEEAFGREMQAVAEKTGIPIEKLNVRTDAVKLDDRDLSSEKLHQALNHSRGVFLGEVEDKNGLSTLSAVVDGIEHNRRLIADAIKKYKYRTSPRIISNNVEAVSIAMLQQGKVNLEGQIRRPDDIIVLPDHPDIALAHDIAQLEDMVRMRTKRNQHERDKPDFYELCRSTLIQPSFIQKLDALMQRHGEEAVRVGFRIKGVPPVKMRGPHWDAIDKLAERGHPLWLDRFGDAVVEPEALKCLHKGFIEMPQSLMKMLAKHFDGKEMMGKLVQTWQAMNVGVISVDLPDYELKTMAQELGISISVEDAPEASV
jgi:EAL domain-containing protein (putative c-di-GMP-specific phosphodiesterase class I)